MSEKKMVDTHILHDSVISATTTKELLCKWVDELLCDVYYNLFKYYILQDNVDAGDKLCVEMFFEGTYQRIVDITSVLQDMLNVEVTSFQDIVVVVYGADSDNAFAAERFLTLYDSMDKWDEDEMWKLGPNDDARLYKLLTEE